MAFNKPEILFFLFFLIIPILIHLLNLKKYKKVYFPNIYFLKKIKTEKKKLSKLKNLLILISRLILLTTLILIFAKPYIPEKGLFLEDVKKISIYIDNSLSMSFKNKTILLEKAKINATEIIQNLNEKTEVNIITNDFEFKNERFYNKEKSLELVQNIQLSPFTLNICEVIERQKRMQNKDSLITPFIISDFQENFVKEFKNCSENISKYNLIKIHAKSINNLSINSCYFKSPFRKLNQKEELFIEIENHSNADKKNIQVELFINNKKRGFLNIDIPKNSISKNKLTFTNLETGNISGRLEIMNDNFKYDNNLFFSYQIKEKINILSISENDINPSIKAVFNDSIFKLDVFKKNQINFEQIENYDLIILDNLKSIQKGLSKFIQKSLKNRKNIMLFPNKTIDLSSYNYLLKELKGNEILDWNNENMDVKKINYEHIIFENVFKEEEENIELPKTKGYYKLKTSTLNQKNNILNFINTDPFIIEYNHYPGSFYLCTAPLDLKITNFTKHAIFLPIMYNAAFNTNSSDLYKIIHQNLNIKCTNCKPQSIIYLKKKNELEIILEKNINNNTIFLELGKKIKKDGTYNLYSTKNIDQYLSLNYNRNEGKNNSSYLNDLEKKSSESFYNIDKKNLRKNKKEKKLIFYFIILGIVSFLFETLLLKFWKN